MENINNQVDNTVSGVERVSKKKGKKIALISGIAVVAIAGGGVAAYNLSDYVKNQINLRVMKPENYYSWIVEENSKEFANKAKDSYSKVYEKANSSYGTSFNLKYNISDDAKELALTGMLGEGYRDSVEYEEQNMLIDIFDNLSEISIGGNISAKTNMFSGNISALLNGESIIDSDIAFDMENYNYFFRVPELTEQWLCLSLGEIMDYESVNSIQNIYKYLTPEELEDIIIRYTNIWNESVSDIELEKQETLDICDISVEYTVISAEFDYEKMLELADNFINELKSDDIIKNIVVNEMEACTEDEYNSTFDDLLSEISLVDSSEDYYSCTLNTYVDPNGDIRGIKFIEDSDELFFGIGKDGDNIRGEFVLNENGEDVVNVELYADKDGDQYNGNIDFTVSEYEEPEQISIEFTGYEVVNEENGYFNADVTLIIPDIDPVALNFSSDGSSQDISYNINVDGTDYGILTFNFSANNDTEPSIPDKDSSFVVDYVSDVELKDYVSQESMQTFIENLLIKIGFSEEVSAEGAAEIAGDMYYEYDEYYYNSYEDVDPYFGYGEVDISGNDNYFEDDEIFYTDDVWEVPEESVC